MAHAAPSEPKPFLSFLLFLYLARLAATTRALHQISASGPSPPSAYPIKVSDLGLVPYNIPTTTTTTSDPEIRAAIQKMRHTLRHPKHCYSDILVAVEGWNQYDEFIQGSAILYEDEMQLPSGTWVWTTKDFKTGIETNTYIGCNTLKGTPVLIRQSPDEEGAEDGILEIRQGGAAAEMWLHEGQEEEDDKEVTFVNEVLPDLLLSTDRLWNCTIMIKDVWGLRLFPNISSAEAPSCTETVVLEANGKSYSPSFRKTYSVVRKVRIPPSRYARLGGFRIYSKATEEGEEMYWLRCDYATGHPLVLKQNVDGSTEQRGFELFSTRRTDLEKGQNLTLLADATLVRPLTEGFVTVTPEPQG